MIQDALRKIVRDTIQNLDPRLRGDDRGMDFDSRPVSIELPRQRSHGDYASNVAMVMSKQLKMKPRDLAEKITTSLVDPDGLVASAEVAGPGFINFKLNQGAWDLGLRNVLSSGSQYGQSPANSQKVLLEYVSANPTGPLHLGHARGAFVGDACARLLKAAGFDVTREFYVNDMGNQVKMLGRSVHARYRELFGQDIELGDGEYPGEYIIPIAQKLKDEDGDKWLEAEADAWLPRCIEIGIQENLKDIRDNLGKAAIEFDNFYRESKLHGNGKLDKIQADYQAAGMLYEARQAQGTEDKVRRDDSKAAKYSEHQKGGTFLKTEQFGDTEDRILIRANGEPVYLTADLAYHQEKYERGFDRIIDVFGADHGGHTPRIRAGMRALGLLDEKMDFLLVQMVRLIKDGKEVQFSKRSGNIILLSELLEDIGSDAARYVFLSRSPDTQFDFDLDVCKAEGSDNPVFYLQYGHARMATLLKRAENEGQAYVGLAGLKGEHLDRLQLPEEQAMIQKMDEFPQVIQSAARDLEPQRVIHYCQELIKEFHGYFTKYRSTERIISDDVTLTQGRLALVAGLKLTIHNALTLLGISAPERMD